MQRGHSSSGIIAMLLIASIAIAWVGILLPSHASTLAITNGVQISAAVRTVSNSALKGNRLVGAHPESIAKTGAEPNRTCDDFGAWFLNPTCSKKYKRSARLTHRVATVVMGKL